MNTYFFTKDYTPFLKGEIIKEDDPRLGENSDTNALSSQKSVENHIQSFIDLGVLVKQTIFK